MKSIFIQITVVLTYLGMIVVNTLANVLPINNVTTGVVSDSYPDLFAPAPITFAIWGLIYILLAGYVLYQLGVIKSEKKRSDLFDKVGVPFIISSIANALWIFAWHYEYLGVSLILMLVILVCLIVIANTLLKFKLSLKENIFIKIPFSVYFGWITVATIANVTTFLVSINWEGFNLSQEIWTVIVLVVGLVITVIRLLKYKDIAFALVVVWAYLGIFMKHTSTLYFNGEYSLVINTTIVSMLILVLIKGYVLWSIIKKT